MRTRRFSGSQCIVLLIALLIIPGRVGSQTFTTLHHFDSVEGRHADNDLLMLNQMLYGSAGSGGEYDSGTAFSLNKDSRLFTKLHDFQVGVTDPYPTNNGAYPYGGLTLCNGAFYGTTYEGGASVVGTVYRMNLDGSGFTILHHF